MKRAIPLVLAVAAFAFLPAPADAQTQPVFPGGNVVTSTAPEVDAAAMRGEFLRRLVAIEWSASRRWLTEWAIPGRRVMSTVSPAVRQVIARRDRIRLP